MFAINLERIEVAKKALSAKSGDAVVNEQMDKLKSFNDKVEFSEKNHFQPLIQRRAQFMPACVTSESD